MKNFKIFKAENGFTLIESIITVTFVAFMSSGLFLAWYLMEKQDRNYEQYWQYKENLELAYQITLQTLRGQAKLATVSTNSDQEISFTGTDNLPWAFTLTGNNYTLTHNGNVETLIANICNNAVFVLNGNKVNITLGVMTPLDWTGINDLNINGQVYIRNP